MSLHSHKRKHTLDSDEEDEVEEVKAMKGEDIEGQEEGTVDFEEGIRFTPFHMKNELEEGTFDENGMYLFKNNKDEIRDEWIEGVNWSQVKEMEKTMKLKEEKEANEKAKEEEKEVDEVSLLKSALTILLPKESVTKAIKRLDKSGGTAGAWQKKKQKLESEPTAEEAENSEKSKQQLSDLISYADKLLGKGMFNIYQETYESLSFKLSEKLKVAKDDVDMFSSDDPQPTVAKPVPQENICDDILWYFKWTNEQDAEVHGPYGSQQMLQWQEDGYFKDGVFVKKSSEENREFYSSRRIDFELYL